MDCIIIGLDYNCLLFINNPLIFLFCMLSNVACLDRYKNLKVLVSLYSAISSTSFLIYDYESIKTLNSWILTMYILQGLTVLQLKNLALLFWQ